MISGYMQRALRSGATDLQRVSASVGFDLGLQRYYRCTENLTG
jgi:hypothetical protein